MVLLVMGSVAGQARITKEEYEIYGLVLTEFFRDRNRRSPDDTEAEKHFVIASKTATVDWAVVDGESRKSSLDRSFHDRNQEQVSLERRIPMRLSYSFADEKEILDWAALDAAEYLAKQEQLRKEGKPLDGGPCGPEWKRFHSRFPESFGYYRLSRIGFSRDHRRAYLEIDAKGATWGEWASYFLRRTKHGWKVQKSGGSGEVC